MTTYICTTGNYGEPKKYTDLSKARAYAIRKLKENGDANFPIFYSTRYYNRIAGDVRVRIYNGIPVYYWYDKREGHAGEESVLKVDGTIRRS